jgi:GAF domain-containing protein/HAMP domain-containing protein
LAIRQKTLLTYLFLSISTLTLYPLLQNDTFWGDEIAFSGLIILYTLVYRLAHIEFLSPLKNVSKNATQIRRGELKHRIPIQKQVNFGNIAKTINRLADNIEQATEFIKAIEEGNLQAQYQLSDDPEHTQTDRLAQALKNMQVGLQKMDDEEQQRNWAREGAALLSETMREYNQDINTLSSEVLSKLIGYLGATQGGIFIAKIQNEEETYLNMVTCYAYNRKKYLQKQIKVTKDHAEGLIGQAYTNGNTIHLKEIPDDYLKISSGLGEVIPKTILITPLRRNEEVIGVLEIASLTPFSQYQIDFLEEIAESLAITLITTISNEQTQHLLKNSREQEEELRVQEEEMRQNMEELQTTQEKMSRKQQELELQNQKMEASERILQKALDKSRKLSSELKEKNTEIAAQEEEMRQNMEELQATQEEMEKQQHTLAIQNQELATNQDILRKQMEKTKEAEKNLKLQEKKLEFNANILKKATQKYKAQIIQLKEQLTEKEAELEELNKIKNK